MKKRYQYLMLALLTVLVLIVIYTGDKKTRAEQIEFQKIAIEYNNVQEERRLKIEELEQAIKSDIPGIVAYGDSLTAGAGGDGVTYSGVLQDLIGDSIYKIPVVNRDVGGEGNVEIANTSEFNNYIPIVFIGENGGYVDNEDLINQINTILNMDKLNDKFIVLGLTSGTSASRLDLEQAMESAFGDRYINLRDYIVQNGFKQSKLVATNEDLAAIKDGSVPPSLLLDASQLNAYGYTIIGNAIYERMNKLGYFENILKNLAELKAL